MQQLEIWSFVPETGDESKSNIVQLSEFQKFRQKPNLKKAASLRKLGDAMREQIEDYRTERATNTAKKAKEATRLYIESIKLEIVQTWLYQMAEAIEANCLPSVLKKITNRVPLEILRESCQSKWYPKELEQWQTSEADETNLKEIFNPSEEKKERNSLQRAGIFSEKKAKEAIAALWSLPEILEKYGRKWKEINKRSLNKEAQIRELQVKLANSQVRGFFPTEDKRIHSEIISQAELTADMLVLEPHGGKGDLIEAILRECEVKIETGEINETLFKILEIKGFTPMYHNFLEAKGLENRYDRVIGNPPWGKEFKSGIELRHISKMYESAKPGIGRIITIVPDYLRKNKTAEYVEFQSWLEILEAEIIELPKDCFAQNKIARTQARAELLIIEKPFIYPVVELATHLKENFGGSIEQQRKTAKKLFKLSRSIYKKALVEFNERSLTEAERNEIKDLEKEVTAIAKHLGTEVDILSDIRGYTLKLKLPSGRSNCWAGDGWWGI
jgi:hypothetical protein